MKNNQANQNLTIEWRHLEVGGETCDRCAGTYTNILEAVTSLEKDHRLEGIEVEIVDTALPEERIGESNLVLINDVPLEELLGTGVAYTECSSCTDLLGKNTCCRAVTGEETLPVEMIRDAIVAAVKRKNTEG